MSQNTLTSKTLDPPTVADDNDAVPGMIPELGKLSPSTIVTEEGLAQVFRRCPTSIKRAVRRGELPPPMRMFGRSTWTVGAILTHLNKRLETASKEAERQGRRISGLRP
jgi:hypothetical protein